MKHPEEVTPCFPASSSSSAARQAYCPPRCARVERNDYPFIRPVGDTAWTARAVNFYNAEIGGGYRLGPATTLKLSYRRDRWHVEESRRGFFPNGYALALQLSRRFDVNSWFNRP